MKKTNTIIFTEIEPAGYYFFGGERTFNTAEKDKYDEPVTNYFAISNLYPQQTALLGLLRHTMLCLYGMTKGTKEQKGVVAGVQAFSPGYDEPYGLIDSLSPVIIYKQATSEVLYPAGLNHQPYIDRELNYYKKDIPSYNGKMCSYTPVLEGFNNKKQLEQLWTDGRRMYKPEDIFKQPLEKVGVKISGKEDAYYRQRFQGLKKGFSFGCWVNFSDSIDLTRLQQVLMPFGADQGLVKISFHKDIPDVFTQLCEAKESFNTITALSDAWISKEALDAAAFGISRYTDFRYIATPEKDYYRFSSLYKSSHFLLLKRGSVLYTSSVIPELENASFKRIGYNYFKYS